MSWGDYTDDRDPDDMEYVWVDYDKKLREIDAAIHFLIEAGDDFAEPPIGSKAVWIPKSQIEDEEPNKIMIPDWLAGEKCLI